MTLTLNTLRPGFLVSVKTSCRGNVRYDKVDIALDQPETGSGGVLSKWETTRLIADATEYEAAKKVQSKAISILRSVCVWSAFGLLCPESEAATLDQAITDAKRLAEEFNASSKLTRVSVYIMVGRIAQDDTEAVRAINSEVRELMDDMAEGLKRLDAKAIRAAANKAKQIGSMLSPDAESKVKVAIDTARSAARKIVKAGEAAALEVDQLAVRQITDQRTAFLDMRDEAGISKPATEARAIDLAPMAKPERLRQNAYQLDVE